MTAASEAGRSSCLWFAHKAALQNGFERRLSGSVDGTNEKETDGCHVVLGTRTDRGTDACELTATANYLDGTRIWL